MGIKLYVGAHGTKFQGRVCHLTGPRCFPAGPKRRLRIALLDITRPSKPSK